MKYCLSTLALMIVLIVLFGGEKRNRTKENEGIMKDCKPLHLGYWHCEHASLQGDKEND
jgi:hypothetical protein